MSAAMAGSGADSVAGFGGGCATATVVLPLLLAGAVAGGVAAAATELAGVVVVVFFLARRFGGIADAVCCSGGVGFAAGGAGGGTVSEISEGKGAETVSAEAVACVGSCGFFFSQARLQSSAEASTRVPDCRPKFMSRFATLPTCLLFRNSSGGASDGNVLKVS